MLLDHSVLPELLQCALPSLGAKLGHEITVFNRGKTDDHLVPFDGTIDWPAALTAIQKVGFEGPLTLELSARGPTKDTLERAKRARQRMERLLCD